MGRSSGNDFDKAIKFNIDYHDAVEVDAPVISNSYLSMECKKSESKLIGDHILYIGEVKIMHLLEKLVEDPILNINVVNPTLYLGVDHYITTDNKKLISMKDLPFHYTSKMNKKR